LFRRCHLYIDEDNDRKGLFALAEAKPMLLDLVDDVLKPIDAFQTFLLGTLPATAPEYSVDALEQILARKLESKQAALMIIEEIGANGKGRDVWNQLLAGRGRPQSTNACLGTFPGVLERIGDFVGVLKSKAKVKRAREFRSISSKLTISDLLEWSFLRE